MSKFNGVVESIVTNAAGGKGTDIGVRFDLVPGAALSEISVNFAGGAIKYSEWNWLLVTWRDHLNHALAHEYKALELTQPPKTPEEDEALREKIKEELVHAATRAIMALETFMREES